MSDLSDINSESAGAKGGATAPIPRYRERLWSPVFIIIIASTLCAFLVGQGSNAGTSVYLERVGLGAGLAGIGAACFSVSAAAGRLVCGPLIDTRGRAIVMVAGACVMLCGTLGPLTVNDGVFFAIWRLMQGLGFAAATTASATAAADVLPLSRLGEGIGYYGLGQAVSMSIGPALAIFLVSTDPPENFYLGLTACAALALVLSLNVRYEKNPLKLPASSEYRINWEKEHDDAVGNFDADSDADASNAEKKPSGISSIIELSTIPGTIPIMFIATAFGFGIFYMGLFGLSIGAGSAGIFYTVSAVAMIAVRLLSSRFMDKAAPIKIMGFGVICALICYSIMLSCSLGIFEGDAAEWAFYLAGIPYGLSIGVALPINQTIAVRLSPSERWGAANATFLLGNDIAIGVASLLWGFFIESFGFAFSIIGVMIMVSISFFAALACYPKGAV